MNSSDDLEHQSPVQPTRDGKPVFTPIESSDLLNRVKAFIPEFLAATARNCDPEVASAEPEIRYNLKASEDETVSMDISLGVFDVNGTLENSQIPLVDLPEEKPLIEELPSLS